MARASGGGRRMTPEIIRIAELVVLLAVVLVLGRLAA
jgi:hypothetical protein